MLRLSPIHVTAEFKYMKIHLSLINAGLICMHELEKPETCIYPMK